VLQLQHRAGDRQVRTRGSLSPTGYGMTMYRYGGTAAAAIPGARRGMTSGVSIWRCKGCGVAYFPQRLLCPRCHGHAWDADRVREGTVEEISIIRHMIGETDWKPRRIASVRTSDGQLITVGPRDESEPAP